jgi:hypothetical protein
MLRDRTLSALISQLMAEEMMGASTAYSDVLVYPSPIASDDVIKKTASFIAVVLQSMIADAHTITLVLFC